MSPRLMVVCLGGLAGGGALVCCNMDEWTETLESAPEGDGADEPVEDPEASEAEAGPALAH